MNKRERERMSGKALVWGRKPVGHLSFSTLRSHTRWCTSTATHAEQRVHMHICHTCKLPHGEQGAGTWLFHPPVAAASG